MPFFSIRCTNFGIGAESTEVEPMQRIAKMKVMEAFLLFIFNFEEDFWFSLLKMEEAFFFMSPLDHLYLWMVLPLLTGPLKIQLEFLREYICVLNYCQDTFLSGVHPTGRLWSGLAWQMYLHNKPLILRIESVFQL